MVCVLRAHSNVEVDCTGSRGGAGRPARRTASSGDHDGLKGSRVVKWDSNEYIEPMPRRYNVDHGGRRKCQHFFSERTEVPCSETGDLERVGDGERGQFSLQS